MGICIVPRASFGYPCTIAENFPRRMSPENLIFTFSATAVAELCEAFVCFFERFINNKNSASEEAEFLSSFLFEIDLIEEGKA